MTFAEEVLLTLRDFTGEEFPYFTDCIRQSFAQVDAVFTRPQYGEFFFHCASTVTGWLSRVLLANSQAESDGSRKLCKLWRGLQTGSSLSRDVMVHALDESRHSRIFVRIVGYSFPSALNAEKLESQRKSLFQADATNLQKSRTPISEGRVIDHLVQMNMGEIRTRAHMMLISPVVYFLTPEENKRRIRGYLEGLLTDEIRHISYTARVIEMACAEGSYSRIFKLYTERLEEFHAITIEQTSAAARAYGQGKFPLLLEI